MTEKSIIVAFHIGRGGSFYNPGHKSFLPYVDDFQDVLDAEMDNLFFYTEEEDEDGELQTLPDEEWTVRDASGNILLEGREEIESETGVLDIDGDYDKTIVKYIEDCTEEELGILYQAYLDKEYMTPELKDAVCSLLGFRRIRNIRFYKTNAEICHQDGVETFYWENTNEDVTEEDAAEWLEEHNYDPISIKRYACEFEIPFCNNHE